MPSANPKLEKQASTETAEPLRQAIVVIEHKIRNLEKRKVSCCDANYSYRRVYNLSVATRLLRTVRSAMIRCAMCSRHGIFSDIRRRIRDSSVGEADCWRGRLRNAKLRDAALSQRGALRSRSRRNAPICRRQPCIMAV